MPAIGERKKKETEEPDVLGQLQSRKQIVDFSRFETDIDDESGGYTLGFYGISKAGKTCTAFSLANLRKEMIPLWGDKFPLCKKYLENDLLPEIKRVVMIDTEGSFKKQKNQIQEKRLFKYIVGRVEFLYLSVQSQVPDSCLEDLRKGITISIESSRQIYEDVELIESTIKWVNANSDKNTLVIFDSASKYKDLIEAKGTIQYDLRILQKGVEAVKDEGFHKLAMRKIWWDAALGMLRGSPGWIVSTFRVVPTSDYTIAVTKSKGREPAYTKTEALSTTMFALDMEYDFELGDSKFSRNITIRNGRWVDENDDENNKFTIDFSTRFSSLKLIESMLAVMTDEKLYSDDNENYQFPTNS